MQTQISDAKFRIRPLRLAFLVEPDDLAAVRKVFRISTALWGGRYNAILPVFRRAPSRYAEQWVPGPSAREFLSGMVAAFEPDFLVPMRDELMATAKGCIAENRIVGPMEILRPGENEDEDPIGMGVSVRELFAHLYEKQFQFVRRHPPTVILPKTDRRFESLIACTFGEFPSDQRHEFLRKAYVELLDAKEHEVTGGNLLSLSSRDMISPLRIGSALLDVDRFRFHEGPMLFYMKEGSVADLIDYWNLRAIGWPIWPLPRGWANEMITQCENFIAQAFAPMPGNRNLMRRATFVCSRSSDFEEMQKYVIALKRPAGDPVTVDPRFPRLWEEWGRDADHAARARVTYQGDGTSAVSSWGEMVTFSEVVPEFVKGRGLRRKATCANVVERLPGAARFIPPGINSLHTAVGEMKANEAWVSREGITIACSSYERRRMWRLPTPFAVFSAWMKEKGYEIELSGTGKIASQMIEALGGPASAYLVAHQELIKTFGQMAHARFETHETDEANTRTTLLGKTVPRSSLMAILARANPQFPTAATNHLESLTQIGAFRLGMRIRCNHCGQRNWYALEELNETLECGRCLKEFDFPTSSPPADAWHYSAAGPFSIEGYAQGSFCVALSLGLLLDGFWTTATWITNFNLRRAGKHFDEADFGIFLRDDSAFVRGNNVYLILGESKSFDSFEPRDFRRMTALAKAFPGATLVFSTFRKTLTGAEKKAIAKIANRGRRSLGGERWLNPVIVLTGVELFSRKKMPYCWRNAGPPYEQYAERPLDPEFVQAVADATQQMHLGMEPYFKWAEKRRQTKWEKMQKKIQQPAVKKEGNA